MNIAAPIHADFASARAVTQAVSELFRPPRRIKPSDAAAQYLHNERGSWSPALAPMMLEPLDMLSSRQYTGIVFCGPARSSKTFTLVHGGQTFIVTCAPGDTLIVQMSQEAARDFSRVEIDRIIRNSPELHARLSPRAKDDNTHDKYFRSGMALKIGWPAISQLSSKTLQYVFLTDYDRPSNRDDVEGEGSLWDQAFKRIETYMSRGKCIAESSPGDDLMDAGWKPSTPHEAPPVKGILSIYNRGTRARWYWGCIHCNERFQAEPGLTPFILPETAKLEKMVLSNDLMAMAEEYSRVACKVCGGLHEQQDRMQMNANAAWLHEGERFEGGKVVGERRRTQIASYWLGGVAAAYQRWDSLLLNYFQALQGFVKTGDEGPLRTKTLSDLAIPYIPRNIAARRNADEFKERLEDRERGVVPEWVRFLTAAVDVQKSRFCVQVIGWGVKLESAVVDRYTIEMSARTDQGRNLAVNPAAYLEDWELLIGGVVERKFSVEGLDGFEIGLRLVMVDSGGVEGVTNRAYEFWRTLRKRNLHEKLQLLKGDTRATAPRAMKSYPDSRNRSDRNSGARGDVPVWMLNVNVLKDAVSGDLARNEPGPGYVHLPSWLDASYFEQITAEVKNEKGLWEKKPGRVNEDWDLHVYNRGACVILGAEKLNWASPPSWAAPMDQQAGIASAPKPKRSLSELARALNG